MRNVLLTLLHLTVVAARLCSVRAVIAENHLLKQRTSVTPLYRIAALCRPADTFERV
jgi:hypothetical protein